MNNLAAGYFATGKQDLAPAAPRGNAHARRGSPSWGPITPTRSCEHPNNLAVAYQNRCGKLDLAALPLFEETLKLSKVKFGAEHPNTLSTMASSGSLRLEKKAYTEAEPMLRECLSLQREDPAGRLEHIQLSMSLLGGALLGQKKYDEAEPLLVKGYEGMKQRGGSIPAPRKPQIHRRCPRPTSDRVLHRGSTSPKKSRSGEPSGPSFRNPNWRDQPALLPTEQRVMSERY